MLWGLDAATLDWMSSELLELLVVPTCFVLAGLLGLRLGTPVSIAAGLVGVGGCHLLAFLVADLAQDASGVAADMLHVASQMLFGLGFAFLVWIARVFPGGGGPTPGVWAAGLLALLAPVVGGLAGSTPTVVTGGRDSELGPIAEVLPGGLAPVAALPLAALPVVSVLVFAVRLARADPDSRRMMWWPVVGVGLVAVLALGGLVLDTAYPGAADVAFVVAAPVVPLATAFGPVRRRLVALTAETSQLNADLAARVAELEASRRRLAAATEGERRRIERDLHDGAQQELLALITHTEVARSAREPEQRDAALRRVAQLARAAYETVRGVSHGVRPAVLDDLGLTAAIRGLRRRPAPPRPPGAS